MLAKRLDEVAWAAFSGRLGVTALKALVPASNLVTVTSRASNSVWETAPGDLRVFSEQTLLGFGASSDDVDRLLRHPFFTTSLRTRLVKALDVISGVAESAAVMPLALSVTSTGRLVSWWSRRRCWPASTPLSVGSIGSSSTAH